VINIKRIGWNDYFMELAQVISKRSPCLNIQVGALITYNNKILSTGYNGPPKYIEHCRICNKYDNHCYKSVHAEQNAIIQCNDVTIITPLTLYTTYLPCIECSKLILNTGIKYIYYKHTYKDSRANSLELLKTHLLGVERLC
jgi:dCMP deaminase